MDDLSAIFQSIQMVCPRLHHAGALIQVLGCVSVGRTHLVGLRMCKLTFDSIRIPTHLIKPGGGHTAESVSGHLVLAVAKAAEGLVDRILAHRASCFTNGREDQRVVPRESVQLAQNRDGLH